jgi:hypothetical protein
VGQQIEVVYKKDNPQEFHRARSFLWFVLFVAIAGLGVGVIYISFKMTSEWD